MGTTPLVVSFGGGVNSAALLIGMRERGIRPDIILFADTAGEKPETYRFVKAMDGWLSSNGFPSIVTVKNDGMYDSLESDCLTRRTLPPIVMGWRTCSDKYKKRPIEKYLKAHDSFPCVMAVGIDAGERHRLGDFDTATVTYQYPLVEWSWGRRECVEAIARAGLAVPVKSACFFCPSSKPHEIVRLAKDHPDLFERATAMERNATGLFVKGLGRHWSWTQVIEADRNQLKMFVEPEPITCMCFDGEDDPADSSVSEPQLNPKKGSHE